MAKTERMTVAEALARAEQIDGTFAAWEETAPQVVASLGGRDALARRSEMTCIGPVLRLDADTWSRMSQEPEDRRLASSGSLWHSDHMPQHVAEPVPLMPSMDEVGEPGRRAWWQRVWNGPF